MNADFELAAGGPRVPEALLKAHGWILRDPLRTTRDTVDVPALHPPVEGGVQCRQARLRRERQRLVQRAQRGIPCERPSRGGSGHGILATGCLPATGSSPLRPRMTLLRGDGRDAALRASLRGRPHAGRGLLRFRRGARRTHCGDPGASQVDSVRATATRETPAEAM